MFTRQTLIQLEEEYDSYHRNDWNKLCHYAGIPLILLALIRWTQFYPPVHVFPWISLLYLPIYFYWSFRMGVAMSVLIILLSAIAYYFVTPFGALILFVVGWVFKFIGHSAFERFSPDYERYILFFFIEPGWLLQQFVKKTIGYDLFTNEVVR